MRYGKVAVISQRVTALSLYYLKSKTYLLFLFSITLWALLVTLQGKKKKWMLHLHIMYSCWQNVSLGSFQLDKILCTINILNWLPILTSIEPIWSHGLPPSPFNPMRKSSNRTLARPLWSKSKWQKNKQLWAPPFMHHMVQPRVILLGVLPN